MCTEYVVNRCTETPWPQGMEAMEKSCEGQTIKLDGSPKHNSCRVRCKAGFRPSAQSAEGEFTCGEYGGGLKGPGLDCTRTYSSDTI